MKMKKATKMLDKLRGEQKKMQLDKYNKISKLFKQTLSFRVHHTIGSDEDIMRRPLLMQAPSDIQAPANIQAPTNIQAPANIQAAPIPLQSIYFNDLPPELTRKIWGMVPEGRTIEIRFSIGM